MDSCGGVLQNGAIAHTSPVYIIADNLPVFDKQRAPAILAKQIKLLDQIISEENGQKCSDTGILQRVEKAKRMI